MSGQGANPPNARLAISPAEEIQRDLPEPNATIYRCLIIAWQFRYIDEAFLARRLRDENVFQGHASLKTKSDGVISEMRVLVARNAWAKLPTIYREIEELRTCISGSFPKGTPQEEQQFIQTFLRLHRDIDANMKSRGFWNQDFIWHSRMRIEMIAKGAKAPEMNNFDSLIMLGGNSMANELQRAAAVYLTSPDTAQNAALVAQPDSNTPASNPAPGA
ncbi:hypothetical protein EJ04DRAFT_561927 [Polyplosphaeria fusca]|uniref:Uncharacterized protein n=1 Tax=Polyplosphaeria fusca TaxID=682080 RepID=A0A9P4R1U1_9PLEO|nr:hypothetical protein EJ04DRAFT_561927 [Polyplosphaeria fusca]